MSTNSPSYAIPKPLIVVAILAAIFYIGGLFGFFADGKESSASFHSDKVLGGGYLQVDAKLAAIDPVKETALLELSFEPKGTLATEDGYLSQSVTVNVLGVAGSKPFLFPAKKHMAPMQQPIDLANGQIAMYPNDAYDSVVELSAASGDGNAAVPVDVEFSAALHGYTSIARLDKSSTSGDVTIEVNTRRSWSTVVFAWFMNLVMAIVAIGALSIAVNVLIGRKKLEFAMFGWIGALLFVFPAIRNALPATPPVGTLTDFAIFFWAEFAVVAAMMLLLVSYLRHPAAERA